MDNEKLGKKRKKLSIEEKAMEIGWRQENVSNSEIAPTPGLWAGYDRTASR